MASERFHCDECMDGGETDDCHSYWCERGIAESAKECDAMFAENEKLRTRVAELEAERERLREALARIRKAFSAPAAYAYLRDSFGQSAVDAVDGARRALLSKGASNGE